MSHKALFVKYFVFATTVLSLLLVPSVMRQAAAQNASIVLPGIKVSQGWTTITKKSGKSTPAYFTIHNSGLTPDTLVSISCSIAHRTTLIGKSGDEIGAIPIKPGQTLTLKPGGTHLMLEQNRFRFYTHAMIPCSADFLGAGTMLLYLHVQPDDATSFQPPRNQIKH